MESLRQAKRLIKIVVGFTLLAIGAAMLVLPGPGIVVITLGLALLAAEFVWARRLLERIKEAGRTARDAITRRADDPPR
jgi:tellurite resistance protein TerC